MEKTCTGQNVHPSCRVNLLSERLTEKKADPFFKANSARVCSNCLKQLASTEFTGLGEPECLYGENLARLRG